MSSRKVKTINYSAFEMNQLLIYPSKGVNCKGKDKIRGGGKKMKGRWGKEG